MIDKMRRKQENRGVKQIEGEDNIGISGKISYDRCRCIT